MNMQAAQRTKIILSRTDNLLVIREFVSEEARAFGFSDEDAANIILAVDEACTNIIKHSYQYATDKEIEVTVLRKNRCFEIRIFDTGRSFDPTTIRQPDLKEHIGHRKRGGLGVYLMKKLMDRVEYDFHKGKRNEVRLIKNLSNASKVAER